MTSPNYGPPVEQPATSIPGIPDLEKEYGPGTAFADSVWQEMDRARHAAMDDMLARAGLVSHGQEMQSLLQQPTGVPLLPDALLKQNAGDQTSALTSVDPSLRQRATSGLESVLFPGSQAPVAASRQDLIDRAKVYGIQGAEDMPEAMLAAAVSQKRQDVVRPDDISLLGWLGAAGKELGSGFGEALSSAASNIPYIGETLDRVVHSSQAAKWLAQMHAAGQDVGNPLLQIAGTLATPTAQYRQENELATNTVPRFYEPYAQFLNKVGYGVGFTLPGIAAWEAAGAMGAAKFVPGIGASLSPISRMALTAVGRGMQSTVADYLLEGGKAQTADQTEGNLVSSGLFGGALGLLEGALPGMRVLLGKAKDAFSTPVTDYIPSDVPPGVQEADWEWEHETGQLGPPSRLLGPGSDYTPSTPAVDAPSPVRSLPPGPGGLPAGQYDMPSGALPALGSGEAAKPHLTLEDAAPSLAQQHPFLSQSVVADENGPIPVYHGTSFGFENFNPDMADSAALWGKGFYHTEDPVVAAGYAGQDLSVNDNPGMQIRKSYLDIRNPFRLDQLIMDGIGKDYQYDEDAGHSFIDKFAAANPSINAEEAHNAFDEIINSNRGALFNPTYEDIHNALQHATYGDVQGPVPPLGDSQFWQGTDPMNYGRESFIGPTGVNDGLKNMGYDGLTHIGGALTGTDPHRVWIAWEPSQVHPMFAPAAHAEALQQEAMSMTKQATVMESPAAANLAGKSEITNGDVAEAAVATRPAGISLIKNIGNLGQSVAEMSKADVHFRFIERPHGVDMLVSNSPISDDVADTYHAFGMYPGQEVVARNGRMGVVSKIGPNKVSIKDPYNPDVKAVAFNHSSVAPRTGSISDTEAPVTYQRFKDYAQEYMKQENAKAGLPPAEWLDSQTSTMLPDILDRWYAMQGFGSAERAGLNEYFNVQRVHEFQALDPEDYAWAVHTANEANAAETAADEIRPPHVSELAEAKGFSWVPKPGTAEGQLWDTHSSLKVPAEDEEAAKAFLHDFNREVPDHTPLGGVPIEAAPYLSEGSELTGSASVDDIVSALDNPEGAPHIWDGPAGEMGGGYFDGPPGDIGGATAFGGGTPRDWGNLPPVTSGGGGNRGGNFGPMPPRYDELGGFRPPKEIAGGPDAGLVFERMSDRQLRELKEKYDGFIGSYMRNTRSTMQLLQGDVEAQTGKKFPLWDKYQEVEAGLKTASAESVPWQIRKNQILSQVSSRLLKDGTFTKVFEIVDTNDRMRAALKAGFTQRDVKAMSDLKNFADDIRDYANSRGMHIGRVEQYLSHVRMREGMPGVDAWDAWSDPNNFMPGKFGGFFAEKLRRGGMTMRQMDPRWLWEHYIHAMHYALDVAPQMDEFIDMAKSPNLPPFIKDIMANWATVARSGYDVTDDLAVRFVKGAVNHTLGGFGVHLTDQHAAHLLNKGLTLMHWKFLGFRPQVLARDAIQPLLAGAKGDMGTLAGAYKDWFSGSDMRSVMRQRAVDGGWAEVGHAPVEMPSPFGVEAQTAEGKSMLSKKEQYTMGMLSKLGDLFRDNTPISLRQIAGTKLDPLYAYQKEGQVNRILAGEVGWRMANAAGQRVYAYNRVLAGLATPAERTLVQDMLNADGTPFYKAYPKAQFLKESALDGFRPVVGNLAWEKVQSSDYAGAADLAGREMANETQFEYGVRQLPPKFRSLSGRMGMQFGTFTNRFMTMLNTGLSNGSAYRRMKFLLTLGGVSAGLNEMSKKTGYNFGPWIWARALGWAGGPIPTAIIAQMPGFSGLMNAIMPGGGQTSQHDVTAAENLVTGVAQLPLDLALNMNPLSGLFETAGAYSAAAQSRDPLHEIIGVTLTGKSALGSSYRVAADSAAATAAAAFALPPESGMPPGMPQTLRDSLLSHHPGSGAIQ